VSALNRDAGSSQGGVWQSLNRLLLTLIFVMVASVVGYRAMPEVSKQRDQDMQIEAKKAERDHLKLILMRDQREENLLKTDREYIGLIARDRLDLMKEGETIFRLDNGRPDTSKMRRNN